MKTDEVQIIVQVNGKLRGKIKVSPSASEDQILDLAKSEENVVKHLVGKQIVKEIFVPNKIINLVVK